MVITSSDLGIMRFPLDSLATIFFHVFLYSLWHEILELRFLERFRDGKEPNTATIWDVKLLVFGVQNGAPFCPRNWMMGQFTGPPL